MGWALTIGGQPGLSSKNKKNFIRFVMLKVKKKTYLVLAAHDAPRDIAFCVFHVG